MDLLHPLSEVVVDLTNNDSFSPEKYPTPTKKRGRQNIQWQLSQGKQILFYIKRPLFYTKRPL